MNEDFMREMHEVRRNRHLAEVERRRLKKLAKGVGRLSPRARLARWFFDAAFALEAEESWRAVWDRMSGKKRGRRRFEKKKCA